eukprot:6160844-Pyramimonas_sp.AAC.1
MRLLQWTTCHRNDMLSAPLLSPTLKCVEVCAVPHLITPPLQAGPRATAAWLLAGTASPPLQPPALALVGCHAPDQPRFCAAASRSVGS